MLFLRQGKNLLCSQISTVSTLPKVANFEVFEKENINVND